MTSKYTRDMLVKSIVANRMSDVDSSGDNAQYVSQLKDLYRKWEHVSSEELILMYNKIQKTAITLSHLTP